MYSICKGVNVITNEHHASFLHLNLMSGEIRTHKKNLVKICRKSWERKTKKVRKKVENVLLLILEEVDSWPALLKPRFNLNYEQKHTAVQLGQVSLESYLNHLDWRKLSDTTQKCSLSLSFSLKDKWGYHGNTHCSFSIFHVGEQPTETYHPITEIKVRKHNLSLD